MKKSLFTNALLKAVALISSSILAIGISSCSNMEYSNAITLQEFDMEIEKIAKEVEERGEYQNFGAMKIDEFAKRVSRLRECIENFPESWGSVELQRVKQLLFNEYDKCLKIVSEDMVDFMNKLQPFNRVESYFNKYSNEEPILNHILTLDISKDIAWNYAYPSLRLNQATEYVDKMLQKSGLYPAISTVAQHGDRLSQIYGKLESGILKGSLFLDIQYSNESLEPKFFKNCFYVAPCENNNKHWHINAKKDHALQKREFTTMSWNYIDIYLHFQNNHITNYNQLGDSMQSILCKKIYEKIRRTGLEYTFKRIIVVINSNLQCSIYFSSGDINIKNELSLFSTISEI